MPHKVLIYTNIKADYWPVNWLGMNILFNKDDKKTSVLGDIHEKLRELAICISRLTKT